LNTAALAACAWAFPRGRFSLRLLGDRRAPWIVVQRLIVLIVRHDSLLYFNF
jgi:hypothetical protein